MDATAEFYFVSRIQSNHQQYQLKPGFGQKRRTETRDCAAAGFVPIISANNQCISHCGHPQFHSEQLLKYSRTLLLSTPEPEHNPKRLYTHQPELLVVEPLEPCLVL